MANLQLAHRFFESASKGNLPVLDTLIARNLEFHILPASLRVRTLNRDESIALVSGFDAFVKSGTTTISPIEIIESADGSRIVAHVQVHEASSPDGLKEFTNEAIYLLALVQEDNETKISKVQIFTDSAAFKAHYEHAASLGEKLGQLWPRSA